MKRKSDNLWYALFTVPLLVAFIMVVIIPFFMGIYYSFFEWNGIPTEPKIFTGFSNHAKLFSDARFLSAAGTTVVFTVVSVLLINILSIAFSLLVTSKLRVRNAVRTMIFMPYLIGGLILGYIWKFVFSDVMISIGESLGRQDLFKSWLQDDKLALLAIVIVFAWQMAGYCMIIYIAGIQGIPEDVMEAAEVDGASYFQRLRKIIFPLLMPSFTICLFMTLSNSFKIYDVNLSLTAGGPRNATQMFAMNVYEEIFKYSNYGYGQAKALIFFLIVALITLTQVALTKRKEVQM